MKNAVKLSVDGLVSDTIVVDSFIPEGFIFVEYPAFIGQTLRYAEDFFLAGQAKKGRQAAYISEADPLYFKWQAGESTEAEWLAKRQEIRDRFPYPGE